MRALAVGHVTLDVYPGGLEVGGSVHYAARTWRALGADIEVVTAAGADWPRPAEGGWHCQQSPATTRFANTYDAAGGRHQHLAAQAVPVEVPTPPPVADFVFLCPVLQDFAPEPWIAALGQVPLRTAGLQGWLKHAQPGTSVEHGPRCDPARFRGLHVAFLSDEDLAGRRDWLAGLCAAVPLVYLTHGAQGASALQGGQVTHIGTHPAQVVDPTGAGDSFAAATVWALAQGLSPAEAGRFGAAAASIMIEHRAAAPLAALAAIRDRVARVA